MENKQSFLPFDMIRLKFESKITVKNFNALIRFKAYSLHTFLVFRSLTVLCHRFMLFHSCYKLTEKKKCFMFLNTQKNFFFWLPHSYITALQPLTDAVAAVGFFIIIRLPLCVSKFHKFLNIFFLPSLFFSCSTFCVFPFPTSICKARWGLHSMDIDIYLFEIFV